MKNLNKDSLENMSYKDITNLLLEQESLNTLELFTKIVELLELPKSIIDTKISDYYTSLTTDKRFVLIDGKWDLRKKHPSDKVLLKVLDEDDEEESNEEEINNEAEIDDFVLEENDENNYPDEDDEDDDLADLVVIDEDEELEE